MSRTPDTHQIAGYELTLAAVPGGFVVSVATAGTGGLPVGGAEIPALRTFHTDRDAALQAKRNAYRFFFAGGRIETRADGTVELIPAAAVPAPRAEVKLAPAAKSTQTKVSDPGLQALDYAIAAGGYIRRGGHEGEASVTLLKSLAKRGHVALDVQLHGRRKVVAGATVTRAGRIAHLRANGGHLLTYALSA